MKTSIIRQHGIFIAAFMILSASTIAQSTNFLYLHQIKNPIPDYREDSKGNNMLTDPVVSSKALGVFVGMFKDATDVRWFQLDDKFLAKFNRDGRATTALFGKNGMHIYTISYGGEKNLPADIRRNIKSTYFDYEITHAIEVNSLGKTAWIVKLEDEKNLVTVKVADNEMEETENYRKTK